MNDQHFLVVDDDADSRNAVVDYLRGMNYDKVTSCRNGAEAIRALERDSSINFIISDWDMPLVNGLTLLQRVRANPLWSSLPFLIITSPISQEAEKVILAAESMVDAYLIKPFRGDALRNKIAKVLETPVRGPQKQVLVVDDDKDAREMLVEYLGQMGFRDVIAVENGKDALAYLGTNPLQISLIVSDWEMPGLSGLELLEACKGDPKIASIPFLMVTSQSSIDRMKVLQAARANVDQYLLKPFNAKEIRGRVEELLKRGRCKVEVSKLTDEGKKNLEIQQHKQAKELFEGALRLDPQNSAALRGLGDALLVLQGPKEALAPYRKAVEGSPFDSTGYMRLATAYEILGMFGEAIALLRSANRQISFDAQLHFQLGRLYKEKGDIALAVVECEKALEIQSEYLEARLLLELLKQTRKD